MGLSPNLPVFMKYQPLWGCCETLRATTGPARSVLNSSILRPKATKFEPMHPIRSLEMNAVSSFATVPLWADSESNSLCSAPFVRIFRNGKKATVSSGQDRGLRPTPTSPRRANGGQIARWKALNLERCKGGNRCVSMRTCSPHMRWQASAPLRSERGGSSDRTGGIAGGTRLG